MPVMHLYVLYMFIGMHMCVNKNKIHKLVYNICDWTIHIHIQNACSVLITTNLQGVFMWYEQHQSIILRIDELIEIIYLPVVIEFYNLRSNPVYRIEFYLFLYWALKYVEQA